MLAVAFLKRALPDEWNQEDDAGIGGVSTSDLIQAVQTARSEGGFAVGGLQLTREAHFTLPLCARCGKHRLGPSQTS